MTLDMWSRVTEADLHAFHLTQLISPSSHSLSSALTPSRPTPSSSSRAHISSLPKHPTRRLISDLHLPHGASSFRQHLPSHLVDKDRGKRRISEAEVHLYHLSRLPHTSILPKRPRSSLPAQSALTARAPLNSVAMRKSSSSGSTASRRTVISLSPDGQRMDVPLAATRPRVVRRESWALCPASPLSVSGSGRGRGRGMAVGMERSSNLDKEDGMAADDEDRDEIDEDEEDDGEKGEEDDEDMDDRNDPFDPYSRAERERSRSSASLIIPSSPLLPIPDRPTVSQPRPPAAVANEVRTPNMRLEGTGGKGSGAKARRKMPTWVTATPVFG